MGPQKLDLHKKHLEPLQSDETMFISAFLFWKTGEEEPKRCFTPTKAQPQVQGKKKSRRKFLEPGFVKLIKVGFLFVF